MWQLSAFGDILKKFDFTECCPFSHGIVYLPACLMRRTTFNRKLWVYSKIIYLRSLSFYMHLP